MSPLAEGCSCGRGVECTDEDSGRDGERLRGYGSGGSIACGCDSSLLKAVRAAACSSLAAPRGAATVVGVAAMSEGDPPYPFTDPGLSEATSAAREIARVARRSAPPVILACALSGVQRAEVVALISGGHAPACPLGADPSAGDTPLTTPMSAGFSQPSSLRPKTSPVNVLRVGAVWRAPAPPKPPPVARPSLPTQVPAVPTVPVPCAALSVVCRIPRIVFWMTSSRKVAEISRYSDS
mmetsp:Transcript_26287/g.79777  ORF Transcript_26287/g.79777 Transcript_26287/m.79777 type:complete len:238 (+) Transcript_26287:2342-3055(+)